MTDRIHSWFAIGAAAILAIGFVGWRNVSAAAARGVGAPVPNPGLSHLTTYATPLADTFAASRASAEPVELPRDPFGALPMPRVVVRQAGTPTSEVPRVPETTKWHVSATLIVGTKRAAIINDVLLNVGDTLPGGVTLTSVERDRVVLTDSKGAAHTVAVTEGEGEP